MGAHRNVAARGTLVGGHAAKELLAVAFEILDGLEQPVLGRLEAHLQLGQLAVLHGYLAQIVRRWLTLAARLHKVLLVDAKRIAGQSLVQARLAAAVAGAARAAVRVGLRAGGCGGGCGWRRLETATGGACRWQRTDLDVLHGLLLGQASLLEAQHVLLLLALLLQPMLLRLLLLLLLLLRQFPPHSHRAVGLQRRLIESQTIRLAEQRRQLGRSTPVRRSEPSLEQIPPGLHVEQITHALLQDEVHRHPELDPQRQHQLDAAATAATVAG